MTETYSRREVNKFENNGEERFFVRLSVLPTSAPLSKTRGCTRRLLECLRHLLARPPAAIRKSGNVVPGPPPTPPNDVHRPFCSNAGAHPADVRARPSVTAGGCRGRDGQRAVRGQRQARAEGHVDPDAGATRPE